MDEIDPNTLYIPHDVLGKLIAESPSKIDKPKPKIEQDAEKILDLYIKLTKKLLAFAPRKNDVLASIHNHKQALHKVELSFKHFKKLCKSDE